MRNIVVLIATFSSLILSTPSQSNRWRGLEPLTSTRTDVERLLGKCPGPNLNSCVYDTAQETIVVVYSDGLCEKDWPFGYNVPVDTVIRIEVSPREYVHIKDLEIDVGSYEKKLNSDASVTYVNDLEGVVIRVFDGKVGWITYRSTAKQEELRCPAARLTEPTNAADAHDRLFEYNDVDAAEEKAYLASFAQLLRQGSNVQGYIVAYGGKRSFENEVRRRLQCQSNHLVKELGISKERITLIDGGFRTNRTVVLYVLPKGGRVPVPYPTIRPSGVERIRENQSSMNALSPCS